MSIEGIASLVKEIAMFAMGLTWKDILKVLVFLNLGILPTMLGVAWLVAAIVKG